MIERLRIVYEVLGGFRPLPDDAPFWAELLLPLWWCALISLALAFGGAGVKFAYIDF
ncbi:MAG TPA: hypothetical protein VFZ53_18300 [Polyangiaceae bacterium]